MRFPRFSHSCLIFAVALTLNAEADARGFCDLALERLSRGWTQIKGLRNRGKAIVVVGAVSSGNLLPPHAKLHGYTVIHVMPPHTDNVFRHSYTGEGIDISFDIDSDFAGTPGERMTALVERLKDDYDIVAGIPGAEPAREFAPQLQAALKQHFPAIALSGYHAAFSDKSALNALLVNAQLPATQSLVAEDLATAEKWATETLGLGRQNSAGQWNEVVLKPLNSSSTEMVYFVRTAEEFRRHFLEIQRSSTMYADASGKVLIQKRYSPKAQIKRFATETPLVGGEYVVNLVRGRDPAFNETDPRGQVTIVTDLWQYWKRPREGNSLIYDYDELLEPHGSLQDRLVDLVTQVADKAGLKVGSVHAEVIVSDDGDITIDFGARAMGCGQPRLVEVATGHSQTDLAFLAFTNPRALAKMPRRYTRKMAAFAKSIRTENAGATLTQRLDSWLATDPAYVRHSWNYADSQTMSPTVDLKTATGVWFIAHPDENVARNFLQRISDLESQRAFERNPRQR